MLFNFIDKSKIALLYIMVMYFFENHANLINNYFKDATVLLVVIHYNKIIGMLN